MGWRGTERVKVLETQWEVSRTETSTLWEKEGCLWMSSSYLWGDCHLCIPSMSPMGPICKSEGCDPGCSWIQSALMRDLIHPGDSMTCMLHILLPSMGKTRASELCIQFCEKQIPNHLENQKTVWQLIVLKLFPETSKTPLTLWMEKYSMCCNKIWLLICFPNFNTFPLFPKQRHVVLLNLYNVKPNC